MKILNKKTSNWLIASVLFLLAINTSYFWEHLIGIWGMLAFLVLTLLFFALLFRCIYLLVKLIKGRFSERAMIYEGIALMLVLMMTIAYPYGVINFEQYKSKAILVATREGGGNCTTELKLREDGTFQIRSICFGVSKEIGTYEHKGDSIFLHYDGKFRKAVLDSVNFQYGKYGSVILFDSQNSTGYRMGIVMRAF